MGDTGEEDEGIILKTIVLLYCDLIKEYRKDIDKDNQAKICEVQKRIKNQEELLYGKDVPLTYQQKVVKLYDDYERVVFYLAKSSNETTDSIRRKSLGERCKFQTLLQESMRPKQQEEPQQ